MNEEIQINETYLKENLRLGFGLFLSFLLAIIAPVIGEIIRRKSISRYDLYELSSIIVMPLIYIGFAKAIYSYRLSKIKNINDNQDLSKATLRYRIFYILSVFLLCLYQVFMALVISPGGPEELQGTFLFWTILYFILYSFLIISAEINLRKANRISNKSTSQSETCC